ncbi:MAG TPA: hypothetical protein VGL46_13400 [Pseudonocardiaceae bacterium]
MSAPDQPTSRRVLGIDPGGTTGFCLLWHDNDTYGRQLWQQKITPKELSELLGKLVGEYRAAGIDLVVACEGFVVGRRAARSKHQQGGQLARDLIGAVKGAAVPAVYRSANQVKLWATDRRMALLFPDGADVFRGKGHAKDGARHALYAAVVDLHWPDPMVTADLYLDLTETLASGGLG